MCRSTASINFLPFMLCLKHTAKRGFAQHGKKIIDYTQIISGQNAGDCIDGCAKATVMNGAAGVVNFFNTKPIAENDVVAMPRIVVMVDGIVSNPPAISPIQQ